MIRLDETTPVGFVRVTDLDMHEMFVTSSGAVGERVTMTGAIPQDEPGVPVSLSYPSGEMVVKRVHRNFLVKRWK